MVLASTSGNAIAIARTLLKSTFLLDMRSNLLRDPSDTGLQSRRRRFRLAASADFRIPRAFGPMPCKPARSDSLQRTRSAGDRIPAFARARNAGPPTPEGKADSFGWVTGDFLATSSFRLTAHSNARASVEARRSS